MTTLPEFTNSYSSTICTSALLPAMYTINSVSPCSTTGLKLWRNYHCLVFFRKACKLPLSLGARGAPWTSASVLHYSPALLHSWRPPVANRPLRPDLVHISGTQSLRQQNFRPQAHIWFSGFRKIRREMVQGRDVGSKGSDDRRKRRRRVKLKNRIFSNFLLQMSHRMRLQKRT